MITIKELTVGYRKGVNVINSLNLTINDNTINGVVGLNGAGKTTLFNAVFGLIKKSSGDILLDGQVLTKKEIAYLPTENYFYSFITGREYLSLFDNSDIDEWNKLFKLPLDTIIDDYSTGMKKKLALLGVIRQNKPIMILDEPFNGLDMESSQILRLILQRLKETGKTLILSSHILDSLTNVCDCIHYLESGIVKHSRDRAQFKELETELFSIVADENMDAIKKLINS